MLVEIYNTIHFVYTNGISAIHGYIFYSEMYFIDSNLGTLTPKGEHMILCIQGRDGGLKKTYYGGYGS